MTDDLDKQLAKELYTLTLKDLIRRIREGEATAADLNVARAICKDADIQSLPTPGSVMADLAATLPFAGDGGTPSH
jgi:hypothetical protein